MLKRHGTPLNCVVLGLHPQTQPLLFFCRRTKKKQKLFAVCKPCDTNMTAATEEADAETEISIALFFQHNCSGITDESQFNGFSISSVENVIEVLAASDQCSIFDCFLRRRHLIYAYIQY